jgi:hypothetical protein
MCLAPVVIGVIEKLNDLADEISSQGAIVRNDPGMDAIQPIKYRVTD